MLKCSLTVLREKQKSRQLTTSRLTEHDRHEIAVAETSRCRERARIANMSVPDFKPSQRSMGDKRALAKLRVMERRCGAAELIPFNCEN